MAGHRLRPYWLDTNAGRLSVVGWQPRDDEPQGAVVVVPPFGEEMNKCRRMFALLAQSLAGRGVAAMLPDLKGTGDSEGDFSASSWDDWLSNVRDVVQWTRLNVAASVHLLAVRSGALLALEALHATGSTPERLVLWAPTVSGRQFMAQFLRMRLASELSSSRAGAAGTAALWEALEAGRTVDVAGYRLPPAVAIPLRERELEPLLRERRLPTRWFEVVAGDGGGGAAPRRVCDNLQRDGLPVRLTTLRGDAFWTTPEIALVPDLLRETAAVFIGEEERADG